MEIFIDCLKDTALDTLKLLPVLFLTYLLMELLEHKAGEKTIAAIRSARGYGPLAGGILGVIPQCGIAGGAAGLYSTGVITAGTFIAVMLATSDEMLPVLISAGEVGALLKFIAFKLIYGIAAGFAIDGVMRLIRRRKDSIHSHGHEHKRRTGIDHDSDHGECQDDGDEHSEGHDHCNEHGICSVCVREGCHCEQGIFRSALHHTVQVTITIFIVSLLIACCVGYIGEERIRALPVNMPIWGEIISGIIGLIPNCSVSVMLTGFYLDGVIGAGPLMAGLLVNGGVGLLVLFRTNRGRDRLRQNLYVVASLLAVGILGGMLAHLIF